MLSLQPPRHISTPPVRLCSCPTAIEAGISRGVLIIIVSPAALHTPLPTWVHSRPMDPVSPAGSGQLRPESDKATARRRNDAMCQQETFGSLAMLL